MKPLRSFASDNNAGVHPDVLKALAAVNHGHVIGYGDDRYTQSAIKKFHEHFGARHRGLFRLQRHRRQLPQPESADQVLPRRHLREAAHIYTDECGAPEKFTGCKLIPIPHRRRQAHRRSWCSHAYHGIGDQHHVQPRSSRSPSPPKLAPSTSPGRSSAGATLPTSAACSCTWTEPASPTPPPALGQPCAKRPAIWASTCSPSAAPRTV